MALETCTSDRTHRPALNLQSTGRPQRQDHRPLGVSGNKPLVLLGWGWPNLCGLDVAAVKALEVLQPSKLVLLDPYS